MSDVFRKEHPKEDEDESGVVTAARGAFGSASFCFCAVLLKRPAPSVSAEGDL
jgi:hypothetical protein